MVPAVDEVWEEFGEERLSSPKSSALAAWRFEPCSTLNNKTKQGGRIAQSRQQREMESLTLALQRELSSSSNNKNKKLLQVSESPVMSSAPSSSSSSRHLDAVGSPVTSSEADTKSPVVAPESSNGVSGMVGPGNQVSRGDGCRASPAPISNKIHHHPLSSVNGGKVSKTRRSRASSKSPITFLNADPANFRAMVQQVTGVPLNPTAAAARLWSHSGGIGVPLPKRDFSSSSARSNNNITFQGLPTLDTSAVLINMSQDRFPAPQQKHSFNSYCYQSPPIHEPISCEPPSSRGEFFEENLRGPCMPSWMKMGGSLPLPFPMSMAGQEMDSSSLADSFLLDSEAGEQHGIPLDLWLNADAVLNNSSKLSQADLSTSSMTTCTSLLV